MALSGKFIFFLFFTFFVLSSSLKQNQDEISCQKVNLKEHQGKFTIGNKLIDIVQNSQVVEWIRSKYNHLDTTFQVPLPKEVDILGTTYLYDVLVTSIQIQGLKTILLEPIEILSSSDLSGGIRTGDLIASVELEARYSKKEKKIFNLKFCPFEWKFWKACPTKTMGLKLKINLSKIKINLNSTLEVYNCAGKFFDKLQCRLKSGWNTITSLFKGEFTKRILRQIGKVEINQVDVTYQKIHGDIEITYNSENLPFDFVLPIKTSLEKDDFLYNGMRKTMGWAIHTASNSFIDLYREQFLGKCYRRRLIQN